MQQSNIDKLEKYRYVYDGNSFSPKQGYTLQDILDVIHDEFDKGYKVDWYCPSCVMRMVQYAFNEMNSRLTKLKLNL